MSLYVIDYGPEQRGCPLLLRGDINHDWEWDTYDPDPFKFAITNEYVYRSKHPLIDFDFWNDNSIASGRFVDICHKNNARVRTVPLQILQSNKKPAAKDYCYLLWADWLSIIDFEASDITWDRDLETGEIIHDRYFPQVPRCEAIRRFVVDPAKLDGRQVFKCIDLDFDLVCTEKFRADCERAGLVGLDFKPIESYQKIPWFSA